MSKTEEKQKPAKGVFEESLAELESIVKQMESGALGLDQMIDQFEKGSNLVKLCSHKLNEVEKRIEKLVKDGQGGIAVVPMEEEI